MIEPQKKRELRSKVQIAVSKTITDIIDNDEEYFFALLQAQLQIAMDLSRFDDIYDKVKEEPKEKEGEQYSPKEINEQMRKRCAYSNNCRGICYFCKDFLDKAFK